MIVGLAEIALVGFIVTAVLVTIYVLLKRAKKFKDYERIRDYLIMGTLIWLVGWNDLSVQVVGSCVSFYGLILLCYNYYKRGYEEGLRG